MTKLPNIFEQNERWAESIAAEDAHFFEKLSSIQSPEYLWIGCSDSRVPANQITGLLPGQVFVHRNVGNIVGGTDLNCLAVLQYAVEVLQVKHIILCGHYGCGAVNAAHANLRLGLIDYWLSDIRHLRDRNIEALQKFEDLELQRDALCEMNVISQAQNVCRTDIVQDAWTRGNNLTVHGWIYRLNDGRLKDLGFCVAALDECQQWL